MAECEVYPPSLGKAQKSDRVRSCPPARDPTLVVEQVRRPIACRPSPLTHPGIPKNPLVRWR